eukprot:CAMPEP_0178915960 /NCGR_PEP_ID=MMETSP0786-20121207/12343_1 /TAXON_ID=186022 /ORGANISM="Thalassionema frauenfeldii, Strain CCMP 1798" /LENGTH=342 /DNA_ID=CAMNT_0020589181 /DNA_START=139 /DNA_END=1164 /DNA_ORIENTATION=+
MNIWSRSLLWWFALFAVFLFIPVVKELSRRFDVVGAAVRIRTKDDDGNCCYLARSNWRELKQKFDKAFFEKIRQIPPTHVWTGHDYDDWMKLQSAISAIDDYCQTEWIKLVMEENDDGMYLRIYFNELLHEFFNETIGTITDSFRYVRRQPELPRVLLLGDSISRGIWAQTQTLFHDEGTANIHGAPANCLGFEYYDGHLDQWLGECPWDVIQFNIGMHFHPMKGASANSTMKQYEQRVTQVVTRMRRHSPNAYIVFALTTPSPFDSNDTLPDEATCANYHKFHKGGFVASLNDVARRLGPKLNITINDRYHAIQPVLGKYQRPCDIHYNTDGYNLLAENDW